MDRESQANDGIRVEQPLWPSSIIEQDTHTCCNCGGNCDIRSAWSGVVAIICRNCGWCNGASFGLTPDEAVEEVKKNNRTCLLCQRLWVDISSCDIAPCQKANSHLFGVNHEKSKA